MKSEENQTIEPMDIQNIVKDVKTIKTMILRARYTAAKMANAEMLKLYFATGGIRNEADSRRTMGDRRN